MADCPMSSGMIGSRAPATGISTEVLCALRNIASQVGTIGNNPLNLDGEGYVVRLEDGTYATNTIVGSSSVIVTNGDGLGGDTMIDVDPALDNVATEVNSGNTGIIVVTGPGTVTERTIVGLTPIVVTDGDGVAGNPTISTVPALGSIATAVGSTTAGVLTSDGAGNVNPRTITGTGAVTVTNGNGATGNPTVSVSPALQNISTSIGGNTTGIVVNNGPGTVVDRTIIGVTPIVVTNGDGVAGNPTVSTTAALSNINTAITGGTAGFLSTDGAGNLFGRTLLGGTGVTITNGTGVAGDATITVSAQSGSGNPTIDGNNQGILVQTGANAIVNRSITGTGGVVVTNANGVAGNIGLSTTPALNNVSTLVGGNGTGYVVQTGPNTVINRAITGSGAVTVTNGDGVAGATSIAVSAGLNNVNTTINNGTAGIVASNGTNGVVPRTITGVGAITVTNGNGSAGNPTIAYTPSQLNGTIGSGQVIPPRVWTSLGPLTGTTGTPDFTVTGNTFTYTGTATKFLVHLRFNPQIATATSSGSLGSIGATMFAVRNVNGGVSRGTMMYNVINDATFEDAQTTTFDAIFLNTSATGTTFQFWHNGNSNYTTILNWAFDVEAIA